MDRDKKSVQEMEIKKINVWVDYYNNDMCLSGLDLIILMRWMLNLGVEWVRRAVINELSFWVNMLKTLIL